RQALQRLSIRARVEHEVVGPDLVGSTRRERPRPSRGDASPRPAPRHLEPGSTPDPMRSIRAHAHSTPLEEHSDPAIPEARVLSTELAHRFDHRLIALGQDRFVTERRTRHREQAGIPGGVIRRARARSGPAAFARWRSPFFSRHFAHHLDLEVALRHQLLQLQILLLELAQPPHIRRLELPEALAPAIDRLVADAVALRHLRHWAPIRLAQDLHHLLFAEPTLLHGLPLIPGGHLLRFQSVRKSPSRSRSSATRSTSRA